MRIRPDYRMKFNLVSESIFKGQIGSLEIVWTPAEMWDIKGDDENRVAVGLSAREERVSDFVRRRPVECYFGAKRVG